MEICRFIIIKNNLEVFLNLMNFPFFLLLIIIQIKCEDYFNSFETNIITEGSSLIDISDYYNISLIITTDKKIYTAKRF